ncbi:MAG: FAD-binding oxidoreductase, partial [Novosphingobium sp.]|uniref:FAD-binding oxidoreductase n=1 Tax=Novosphingobium sp. TaxID=1874826 RepID=UPI003C7C8F45
MTDLIEKIAQIVGPQGLITGSDVQERAADFMGFTRCMAKAIVRPASTAELSAVMKLCRAAGQTVVAAGGNTGLVQGQVCTPDDIQVSLERMRAVGEIDPVGRTMVVEAGCVVQTAQEAAEAHGLKFAVDWGARGSATIGGGIATNAGGNSVVRFGMMRENVLGLEAVLADGTVISSMNVLLKNNAAYDLKQLFIGSEGTLGIVTRAVLKLHPAPLTTQTAMLACPD